MVKDCRKPEKFKERNLVNVEGLEIISGNKSQPLVSVSCPTVQSTQ
jgi:hypothetical protein